MSEAPEGACFSSLLALNRLSLSCDVALHG